MNLRDFVVRHAETVATVAHAAVGQVRNYTGEPYITHPRAVVELVKRAEVVNHEMLAAAWLHDVLEDTRITLDQINYWFGPIISGMVCALTNCPLEAGNRRRRFEINRDRLAFASSLVQTIKVCDLIDNTKTIVEHDPKFAKLYLAEKLELLDTALTKADRHLWQDARDQCREAQHALLHA